MKTKRLFLATLLTVSSVLPGVNAFAASETWGPARDTFTWESPADHRTFNSITNNPSIGDERNFVRVREAGTNNVYTDDVQVSAGKEYEIYIYYHNNASSSLNASGKGMANNVRVATELPSELHAGEAGIVKGTISATNATPTSVWDTAHLNATETVYLRYVENSAVLHNGGTANGSVLDAPSLFGAGAKIAYNTNYGETSGWGIIPGCNEYAGYITYRVFADQPGFYMEKTVSAEGKNEYTDKIDAKAGDLLDFKIWYKNTGTTIQRSVKVYDVLPEGMTYVKGTTFAVTPAAPNGVTVADKLFTEGLVIGDFKAGEEAVITYQVRLANDATKYRCGGNALYNNASLATANGTIYDKVKVNVERICETPAEIPQTGPGEIAFAGVVLTMITVGGAYWLNSYRKLRKTTLNVQGASKNVEQPEDLVKESIINKEK